MIFKNSKRKREKKIFPSFFLYDFFFFRPRGAICSCDVICDNNRLEYIVWFIDQFFSVKISFE